MNFHRHNQRFKSRPNLLLTYPPLRTPLFATTQLRRETLFSTIELSSGEVLHNSGRVLNSPFGKEYSLDLHGNTRSDAPLPVDAGQLKSAVTEKYVSGKAHPARGTCAIRTPLRERSRVLLWFIHEPKRLPLYANTKWYKTTFLRVLSFVLFDTMRIKLGRPKLIHIDGVTVDWFVRTGGKFVNLFL